MVNPLSARGITIAALIQLLGLVLVNAVPGVEATHDPNDFFTLEADFPGVNWNDIHGVPGSTTDVWAVGEQSGAGVIAKRTGGTWNVQTVPNDLADVKSVYAISSTVAVAIGNGVTDHVRWDWNGAVWTSVTMSVSVNDGDALGIWLNSTLNAGGLLDGFWVGEAQLTPGAPTLPNIGDFNFGSGDLCIVARGCVVEQLPRAVHGIDFRGQADVSNDVWMVGGNNTGSAWRFDNAAVTSFPILAGPTLNDVQMVTTSNVWAVGGGVFAGSQMGRIMHFDGTNFVDVASPTTNTLNSIWAVSASNIWAVGEGGHIIHYDGTSWTREAGMETETSNADGVWCADAPNCWIVYDNGEIHKLQVNPSITFPYGQAVEHNEHQLSVTVSQAQCLGDRLSVSIDMDDVAAGISEDLVELYIVDAQTNTTILKHNTTTMFRTGPSSSAHSHFIGFFLPAGDYFAYALADYQGVGAMDHFDTAAFNVPGNDCGNQNVLNALEDLIISLEGANVTFSGNVTLEDPLLTGTTLGDTSTVNILVLVLMVWLSYLMYRRANDFIIRTFWSVTILIIGMASMNFVDDWAGILPLSIGIGFFGAYLMLKSAADAVQERRTRREPVPYKEHD